MSEEKQEVKEEVKEEQQQAEEKQTETKSSAADEKTERIPYDRFQQVIEEKNEYKNELEKLKDKLDSMDDPEQIKSEYESKMEEIESKYIQRQKEFAVKEAALAEGVNKKALDDFAKVADLSTLEVEDGQIKGVDELIKTMKEEKDYFFSQDEKSSKSGSDFKEGEKFEDEDYTNKLRKIMGLK